jgi:hypothetical protein
VVGNPSPTQRIRSAVNDRIGNRAESLSWVLHTDADLDVNGLAIPKGDYTLYADLDNGQWKLIVNKTLMAGARHIWGVGVFTGRHSRGRHHR